ncbi:IS110 family transposase, partial [Bacillus sp. AFS002410]
VINPLISYRAKSSSLRKVKTDVIDAYHLCELYYKEELEPHKKRGAQLLNLRNLTRQHDHLTGISSQAKLHFLAILDQVFPEYRGVFGDLYSNVSLLTLLEFPSSEAVLQAGEDQLAKRIASLCTSRSKQWANERAKLLMTAAEKNPFQVNLYRSLIISLEMHIKMVLQYKEHLSNLKAEIDVL